MSLLTIFLQTTVAVATAPKPAEQGLSIFDLLIKGGVIMIPILLLSLLSVYLFVERLLFINKASKIDINLVNNVKDMLIREDIKGALTYCDRIASPFAKIVHKGLSRLGSPIRDIESAIGSTARVGSVPNGKRVNLLAAIAALAPMFGFLGTVVGMIRAFLPDISMSDNISIRTYCKAEFM